MGCPPAIVAELLAKVRAPAAKPRRCIAVCSGPVRSHQMKKCLAWLQSVASCAIQRSVFAIQLELSGEKEKERIHETCRKRKLMQNLRLGQSKALMRDNCRCYFASQTDLCSELIMQRDWRP